MNTVSRIALVTCMAAASAAAPAATYLFPRARDTRKVIVVRRYEIPVVKGGRNTAGIPAMMSFWGATNEQVILQSKFTYSVEPDEIKVTADDLGMRRRNFELTWNAPEVETIAVEQRLAVQITCLNTLATAAKLPYPDAVRERLAASLAASKAVNGENAQVVATGKAIARKARYASEAVELACAWVDDHVKFKSGSPTDSDTVLSTGQGNCGGMSNLACALLRSMGVPAETVSGTFLGGGGHAYLEAYFPDAGWVFYDCSNCTRGYKSLDCLAATGWAFRVMNAQGAKWHDGHFLEATDAVAWQEDDRLRPPVLHPWPKARNVQGVRVIHREPPAKLKVRHVPISRLIMDLSIPPGKREYVNPLAKATAPEPKPAPPVTPKPAERPKPKPKPAPRPAESPAARQLKVARMYLGAGLREKGAKMLQDLVRRYPDTKEAAEARKLLEGLAKPK